MPMYVLRCDTCMPVCKSSLFYLWILDGTMLKFLHYYFHIRPSYCSLVPCWVYGNKPPTDFQIQGYNSKMYGFCVREPQVRVKFRGNKDHFTVPRTRQLSPLEKG